MRFFRISTIKTSSAWFAFCGGVIFLFAFFFGGSLVGFAQSSNTELANIVKQIQEAIARGGSEEEIAELQYKLFNTQVSQSVEVKVTPEYPGPNEDVTIEIISYQTDLQRAKITWESGGRVLSSGFGVVKQSIRTKNVGEKISLAITIRTYEGLYITKSVSVLPLDLEMQWEASTYSPAFYRGKALPSPRSEIKVVALPNFTDANKKRISDKDLVYVWRAQNGTILNQGYGKNFAYTPAPDGAGFERPIDVEVSSLNNALRAKKRFFITSFSPIIQLYEDNPLLGIVYDQTLKQEVILSNDEIAVRGEPFFFSRAQKDAGKLSYRWTQNGKNIANENGQGVIFRQGVDQEEETSTISRIDLSVKNPESIFEGASRSFTVRFNKTRPSF